MKLTLIGLESAKVAKFTIFQAKLNMITLGLRIRLERTPYPFLFIFKTNSVGKNDRNASTVITLMYNGDFLNEHPSQSSFL